MNGERERKRWIFGEGELDVFLKNLESSLDEKQVVRGHSDPLWYIIRRGILQLESCR